MKKPLTIEDVELDEIIKQKQSDVYAWDPTKIIVDPQGIIVKTVVGEDPAFYTFLDELLK